ncbi:iron-containing alcohol dehydrogenase [Verrucomicrobia bacterium]|nr:iron-containing alcohol dehydrogenase [Verrucomicrobiota bacterium]
MLPALSIVDPSLTLSCPPAVTAFTGLDTLTQLIEPFLSCKANPMTDGFCRQGIPMAVRSIQKVFQEPRNKQARTEMAHASLLGGLALANAGLGVVHGIAGPFGGMFPNAPHGAVCAALLPAALEVNNHVLKERYCDHPCQLRLRELAGMVTGNQDATFEEALAWIHHTVHLLNIPCLGFYGCSKDDVPLLIEKSIQASSMKGNPVPLLPEEIADIIQRVL